MACAEKRGYTQARIKETQERVQAAKKPCEPLGIIHENPVSNEGLVCWWCVHPLPPGPIIHFPTKYDEIRKQFTTKGNFCSWECAKAYGIDMNHPRSGEMQMFLALMRKQAFGKYISLISAPKRETLKIFGGTLSIDEFRLYRGKQPPTVEFPNQILLTQIIGGQKIEPNTVDETGEMLKRPKPLQRSKSKLESALGITRKAK